MFIAFFIFTSHNKPKGCGASADVVEKKPEITWDAANKKLDAGDLDGGLNIALTLAAKAPNDYGTLWSIGRIYIRKNDYVHAREALEKAYTILPLKGINEELEAVKKRMAESNQAGA